MRAASKPIALAALLVAGCTQAAPSIGKAEAGNLADASEDLSFVRQVADARLHCAEYAGEISEHPEADARADFAAGKRGGVGFFYQSVDARPEMPADFSTAACPAGRHRMRYLKGLEGDVATCLALVGSTYVERYNRELMRLCASKH